LDEEGFRKYCRERGLKEGVQENVEQIMEFEAFLKERRDKTLNDASLNDVKSFVADMTRSEKITRDTFRALIRYSSFSGKKEIISVLYGYLEGLGVPEKLQAKLEEIVGESKSREMFEGIDIPPLGAPPEGKPETTMKIMERLEANLDCESLRGLMSSGLEVGPDEWYAPQRKKFQEAESLDSFLEEMHKDFVKTLERHSREGTMFFAQEIDDEVVEYVRKNQEIQGGVREGDLIYVTKIPYQAKKYLHEKDERMRRYHFCHCSWVREAIKSGTPEISPNFCYCSAGYHKRPFEIIFGQPIKVDVVETVLEGDAVCRFAIRVPEQYLKPKDVQREE
jgi:predicted hydrocarbon binding protein